MLPMESFYRPAFETCLAALAVMVEGVVECFGAGVPR